MMHSIGDASAGKGGGVGGVELRRSAKNLAIALRIVGWVSKGRGSLSPNAISLHARMRSRSPIVPCREGSDPKCFFFAVAGPYNSATVAGNVRNVRV